MTLIPSHIATKISTAASSAQLPNDTYRLRVCSSTYELSAEPDRDYIEVTYTIIAPEKYKNWKFTERFYLSHSNTQVAIIAAASLRRLAESGGIPDGVFSDTKALVGLVFDAYVKSTESNGYVYSHATRFQPVPLSERSSCELHQEDAALPLKTGTED